jgi:hypothetical protein
MGRSRLMILLGVACLALVVVLAVFLLRRDSGAQDSPELAAAAWVNAAFAGDTNQLRRLTCAEQHETLEQAASLLAGAGRLTRDLGGMGLKVSADDLSFQTTEHSDSSAVVRVNGKVKVRLLVASHSEDLSVSLHMVRERNRWKYCDIQV